MNTMIAESKDLMLIIDMQNVYLPNQPWACLNMTEVTDNICHLIDHHSADHFIFTRYLASHHPIGTWREYNERYQEINDSLWMAQIISPLVPYTTSYPVFNKSTYSCYGNPDLAGICKTYERIVITGVVAHCCILSTIFSAIDTGSKVIYLTDAISGPNLASIELTKQIVDNFSPLHTITMTTKEYIAEQETAHR